MYKSVNQIIWRSLSEDNLKNTKAWLIKRIVCYLFCLYSHRNRNYVWWWWWWWKRCLFTTQIMEHTAYSLLIRVDNGLEMWARFWALVKWSSLLITHYYRKSFLQCILNVGSEQLSHSNGILPLRIERRFANIYH